MTVYVDCADIPFGNMLMSHCWADSVDELLEMMDKIGVQRKWIQGHPTLSFGKHKDASWVHFDISMSKKKLALMHGAVQTDKYGPSVHTARLRLTSPRLLIVLRALRHLDRIEKARKLKDGN